MQKIGQYEVLKEIGQGSLAIVYQAFDPQLRRDVALKILHPIFSKNQKNIERLRQEAQTLAQLDHPHILRIYSFLDQEEAKGIVTEYVQGQTLAQFLEKHSPVLPEIGLRIIADILEALEHAHSRKIVHRDIKPENIIINTSGEIKIADFSIAKIMGKESLTLTGQLVGSPFYLSPEQAVGEKVDERADLFSVGVLLFRLVTGDAPFMDQDPAVLLKKILTSAPPRPTQLNPKISKSLERILLKALEKDRAKRYQKAWEFRYDILNSLKEYGLSLEEIELNRYFETPKEYEAQFLLFLTQHYVEEGLFAFKAKQFEKASCLWNRVLEYDPHHLEVRKHLRRLSRHHFFSFSKHIVFGIGFAVFALVIYLLFTRETNLSQTPKPVVEWAYLTINKDPETKFFLNDEFQGLVPKTPLKLPVGSYQVRFEKKGFKPVLGAITLKSGETSVINIKRGE